MIRYSLLCANEDAFEGWFRNSADYDAQLAAGGLHCPLCGSTQVRKAPMAPAVIGRKGRREEGRDPARQEDMLRRLREHVQENFEYVGQSFADEARAMHDGDAPERPIWGQASVADAVELIESGVPIAPLPIAPLPVAPLPVAPLPVAPLPPGAAPRPPKRLH